MLLWQFMVGEAKRKKIDRDEKKALEWIKKFLPNLFQNSVNDAGEHVEVLRLFDWGKEWKEWQKNFEALNWLAQKRNRPPKPNGEGDVLPSFAQQALNDVLAGVRIDTIERYSDCNGVKLMLSARGGIGSPLYQSGRGMDDIAVLWQATFLSFCDPVAISSASVCRECGRPLPSTKKLGKPSKQRICRSCNTKKWRRENPDAARELYREQKRKERETK